MKKYLALGCLCLLFTASCSDKKDNTPTPSANGTVNIDSAPRVTCKIDGADYSRIADGINIEVVEGSDKQIATAPDTSTGKYQSSIGDANSGLSYFEVNKGTMKFMGGSPENADFLAFLAAGSYPFSPGALNGVVIEHWDASGTKWSTELGTMDQSGSSFTITAVKGFTVPYYYVKVMATFNCKLYNGAGQYKTVTDGVFISTFGNI